MMASDRTLWLLIATAFLMLIVPGVALFYGGMVRKKNSVNTMGLPLVALVMASLVWLVMGDAVIDGTIAGVILGHAGSESAIVLAHGMMAAALALALVVGGIVERIRLSFFLVFGFAWLLLVYGPIAHWLWGGGWLSGLGSLDFAGGAVIHISAGVTALVAAVMVGPRKGYGRVEMMPHHLPLSFCGAGLMWVGWFGFSAGQSSTPITTATSAFVAIQLSGITAALTWMAVEWLQRDKPTALGMASGAVAGLVAITPAAGYVEPLSALVIGLGAGGLCYMVVNFVKPILGYDDSLDVFGMHGVGGTWGMIATGLFASTAANPDGSDGLFYGYPYQLFAQLVAVLAVWAYAAGMTFLIIKTVRGDLDPRVDDETEIVGLDLRQHGEKGYT